MNLKQARRKEWRVKQGAAGLSVLVVVPYKDKHGYSYDFVVHEFPVFRTPRHPSKRELTAHAKYIADLHNNELKRKERPC